MPFLNFISKSH